MLCPFALKIRISSGDNMSKIKRWFVGILYSCIGCVNCICCIATIMHFVDMIHATGTEFVESFLKFVYGIAMIVFLPYWFGSIIKDDWQQ